MQDFVHNFFQSFIPLFVAIDVLSVVPIFLSFTEKLDDGGKKKLITSATLTAFAIAIVFLLAGRLLFRFLGITENDFRIGGGIILLVLSIMDLLFSSHQDAARSPMEMDSLAVVPLGIPLIVGPTSLTTILILVDSYGYVFTFLSLVLNLMIVWLVFRYSKYIAKFMGKGGAKAFAKVSALFMTAIAVMMIRIGLTNILAQR